ncbi:hypothetical protein HELRODRAFT_191108 [Helobdella robusta]|uniref:Cytochrome P450 n=1 Tax=Helobdella robusta TaxID=6412 RepID=T1FSL5_HELRO|nr:hypothetical protein HELRODRAFT_191108 [Helobdella robusta]ESO07244.1 hypothetical protein HELRODRAFT_191108 [Helobdella robusta]
MDVASSIIYYIFFLSTLIAGYGIYKVFQFFKKIRVIGKVADTFPMEEKHWFWGHIKQFPGLNEDGIKFWHYMIDKYPRCYNFWALNWFKTSIQVYHPETIRSILKTAEPKSMTMGVYKYGKEWIGEGLLLSSGEKWSRSRKLLTPIFHFDNLHKFLRVKNSCVDTFMKKLSKYDGTGESVEITRNLSALTMDIILRCAFSYDNDIQEVGENHPYMKTVRELGDLWMKRTLKPWQHFDFIYKLSADSKKFTKLCKYIHDISDGLIKERKEEYKTSVADKMTIKNDILDLLLKARDEDGNGLSDDEMRVEVNTILFAGHDTTSISTTWVLYSLAQNPHIQKQCQEEIDEMFAGKTTNDINCEDFQKLFYLTCCIKESLRLNTTVPAIERELTKPLVIDGKECPAGTVLCPMLYHLHHNKAVWSDYAKFDPERFFPDNIERMDPFAFVPFSAGPRNCIGQHFAMNEMRVILSKVLQKYTVTLDPDHVVRRKLGLVMTTENGLYLKVSRR